MYVFCTSFPCSEFFFFFLWIFFPPPSLLCNADDLHILHSTRKALKEGQVIAVPTDTIYGLACLAQNSEAIKRVYEIKGRNGNKPLAICVGEVQDIYKCVFCDFIVPCLMFKLLQHSKCVLFSGIVK